MDQKDLSREERREKIRERLQNNDNRQLITIPAEEKKSLNDTTVQKRVCAYCRVSTDDPAQTTSYELQKEHYEKVIQETEGWIFSGIYADEGISATSMKKRDAFNRMIEDCKAGKIDVIVTKAVSRFARNVLDCVRVVRELAQLNPPVGVKFETEGIYTLESTSEMILTVLAAAAQEESKTKSNSMNWSLERRFDKGNFLTPVLLGFDHDEDGNLVINPDEADTVRLCFYLYLSGFPLSEIAELLTQLNRTTKKGNTRWSPSAIRQILINERHCGNVLSWKTYTYDFWEHKKRKNRKNRKQVLEIDHHEAIVTHEIFDAVQVKLECDKYSRKGYPFPMMQVVEGGVLNGFVSVNRMWKGFSDKDYRKASESAYETIVDPSLSENESSPSDQFELDGFEIVRSQFFTTADKPVMTLANNRLSFNTTCLNLFQNVEYVELLLNTVEKCIAIRPCSEENPNAIRWGRQKDGRWIATQKSITGFAGPLFSIMNWNAENRYRLCGQYLSDGIDQMLLFDLSEPEIYRLISICNADTADHFESEYVREGERQLSLTDAENSSKEDFEKDGTESVTDAASESESGKDDEEEIVSIIGIEKEYPKSWNGHFGENLTQRKNCLFERIRYKDNWEILRPTTTFETDNGVNETIIREVQAEVQKMLANMERAV